MSAQNTLAKTLRALIKPGNPLVLTNVWDAISAKTVAALPETKAVATASYAVAAAAGLEDPELTLDVNLRAVEAIAKVIRPFNKPLTVDIQDAYADQLNDAIRRVVKLGAVGVNLEDLSSKTDELYSVEEAQDRIKRTLKIAAEEGVPDFVINARTDALIKGQSIDDAIARGKAYLDVGATTAFIWGGSKRGGTKREEIAKASKELGGMINVSLVVARPGGLTVKELTEIGVGRMSVGPQIMMKMTSALEEEVKGIHAGKAVV